jgi:hypothetical protein
MLCQLVGIYQHSGGVSYFYCQGILIQEGRSSVLLQNVNC